MALRVMPLIAVMGLSACSLFTPSPIPPIYLKEVNLSLDSDANSNSATAIDLLIVYDPDLLKVLLGLEAKDYYSIVKQVKQDYPELADILHWELTPGQVIKNYPINLRSDDPQGVVMFANYYAPGPQRVRIGSSKIIHVHFKANDFCVIEQGCFGEPNPDMSDQAAAMQANFVFKEVKKANPQSSIASVEAAKAAQAVKGSGDAAKKMAAQAAKFSPK